MIVWLALYLSVGVVTGMLSGLLGIGGGLIIVPALLFIFSSEQIGTVHQMHLAIGSSLAIMVFTSQSSVRAHHRYGRILWSVYKLFAPGILLGAVIGVLVADFLATDVLKIIFGIFLLVVAGQMLLSGEPKHSFVGLPNRMLTRSISVGMGGLSGMLGVGGGSLIVPYLNYHRIPLRNSIAIGALVSLTVALVGSLVCVYTGWDASDLPRWSSGFIYWPAVLTIAISSMVFAPLGAKLTYHLPVPFLKRLFAIFLSLTALKMLVS
ncbi:MAG: TSUP family transporter [Legionellales bacterium]|nr:TSUP family transporter [Legionellales bacterium]